MKLSQLLSVSCLSAFVSFTTPLAQAAVVEVGDLNIIDDAGNASDGLRYLDISYSVGLTLADALTNAQATYANVRVATPTEFDDLFVAAGIGYDGGVSASGGFEAGVSTNISTGTNYDGGVLMDKLGRTSRDLLRIWTDPDGSNGSGTRDFMRLGGWGNYDFASVHQSSIVPAHNAIGWLLVSEVPVPAAGWLFMSALIGLVGKKQLSR